MEEKVGERETQRRKESTERQVFHLAEMKKEKGGQSKLFISDFVK